VIAPRSKNDFAATPEAEDRLRRLIEELRARNAVGYGEWCDIQSDVEALEAVIVEIGQVVLARSIRVNLRETGLSLELKVSNRHLVAVDGAVSIPAEATSQQVVEILHQALHGARSLQFDVMDHSPSLPKASRSWPHDALWHDFQALRMGALPQSHLADVSDGIKAVADSWLSNTPQSGPTSRGSDGALQTLAQVCELRVAVHPGGDKLGRRQPSLAILDLDSQNVLVELVGDQGKLFAIVPQGKRTQIMAIWQRYRLHRHSP
jgi:hypothetical protein